MTTERVEPAEQQWRARPVLAATLRLVLLAVPLVASTGATFAVSGMLPPGAGSTWWGLTALLAIAVAVAVAVERAARRLLPIALLLKLSMIFPDRAPSRLKLARSAAVRTPSTEIVWSGDDDKPTSTADLVLNLVSALGSHDRRTRGHSERVRLLCDMLAEELKLDVDARDRLRWSALLHDVGKMKVATSILNKPGRLDPREFDRVKQHPAAGAELAAPLLPWLGEWGDGILDHHEKYDGSGYPNGKSGPDISQAGRIIGLIDAFETMTAARPYKKAMATKVAREELARCAGTHFDPVFVRAFLAISLPRVLWTMGPLSFLFQLPFIRPLAEAGVRSGVAAPQAAAAALVSGATGAAVLVSGGLGSPSTPPLTGLADQAAPGVPQSAPQWLHDQLGSKRVSNEVVAGAATTTLEPADEQQQARQEVAAAADASPRAASEPQGAQEQPAASPTDEPVVDEVGEDPHRQAPVTQPAPLADPPSSEPAEEPGENRGATDEPALAAPGPAPTSSASPEPVTLEPPVTPSVPPSPSGERVQPALTPPTTASPVSEPSGSPSPTATDVDSAVSASPGAEPEVTASASPTPSKSPSPEPSATVVVEQPTAQLTVSGTGPIIASGPASPSASRTATFTLTAIDGVAWQCQVLGNATGTSSAWQPCPAGEHLVTVVGDGNVTLNVKGGSYADSWTWTVQTVTVSPRSLSDVLLLDEVGQPDGPVDRADALGLMALLMGAAVPVAAAARRVRSRSS